MSGTSFAAPLVSGAIALIQDRWPWLKSYPRDVAKIILESAQALGAPGVDPIYGHGLLDIQAAQSALDFETFEILSGRKGQYDRNFREHIEDPRRQPIWSTKNLYSALLRKSTAPNAIF